MAGRGWPEEELGRAEGWRSRGLAPQGVRVEHTPTARRKTEQRPGETPWLELMERGWEGKGLQDLTTGSAQGAAQLLRAVERETGSVVALKNFNFIEELENEESAAALKNGVETTAVDITEGVLNGTNTNVMDNETESAVVAALKNCVDDCICSDGESVAAAALKNDVCETANARGAAEIADEDQNCMRSESESESQSESQSQSQSQNQSQSGNRQSQSQSQSQSRSQSQSQSRSQEPSTKAPSSKSKKSGGVPRVRPESLPRTTSTMQMHDRRVEGVCFQRKPGTESLGNGVYETTDMNGMLEDSNKDNMNTGTSTGATSPMRRADRRVEGVCGEKSEEMQRIRGGRLGRLKRGGGSRGPRPCGVV